MYFIPSCLWMTSTAVSWSASRFAFGSSACASSAPTPFDNMGVMTMKMMSITSMTSTIGVTLMSATGGGAWCLLTDSFFFAIVFLHGTREEMGPGVPGPGKSTRRIHLLLQPENLRNYL